MKFELDEQAKGPAPAVGCVFYSKLAGGNVIIDVAMGAEGNSVIDSRGFRHENCRMAPDDVAYWYKSVQGWAQKLVTTPKSGAIVKAWDKNEKEFVIGIYQEAKSGEEYRHQVKCGDEIEGFHNVKEVPKEISEYVKKEAGVE